jgi:2,3-bisphosphoglycerate-independent phosphoglycerate mutase
MKHPATLLIIMDGYGLSPEGPGNAISRAQTPYLDELYATCPHTSVKASGKAVGLPKDQMGNSEVGHLNMGAGRIVWQELSKISDEIDNRSFFKNPALLGAMHHVRQNGSALHLMGLLSDGGVHSHISHLYALLDMAGRAGLTKVYIHGILDGRDVGPTTAPAYVRELEKDLQTRPYAQLASLSGRYYAMDRDNRWDRVEKAYRAYTLGEGPYADSAEAFLRQSYAMGITDEFVLPGLIAKDGKPIARIEENDALVFFNFRPDRAREITRAFVDQEFDAFARSAPIPNLHFVCLTQYDLALTNVYVAFPPQILRNTLGEYLAALGKKQLRIAETEKYAHVTFFFNGGVEKPNPGEDRLLIPSPKVPTYDLQPEMSAYEITRTATEKIEQGAYDVIILNLANCDMVAHTGVIEAAVRAVEAVDDCVGMLVKAVQKQNGCVLITADHGNADYMLDAKGHPVTAHSTAPVPVILTNRPGYTLAPGGSLCDIAPTLLELMDLPIPSEMTGQSLLRKAAKAE